MQLNNKKQTVDTLFKGVLALTLAGSSQLFAQDEEEDDVFELSPFTVQSSTEGYRATSTLAGSRISTELKDLGAAISVVTSQFLEDTGSTDAQELFANLTSLEIGGVNGNYSTSDFAGGADWGGSHSDAFDINPQSSARVRGLETPDFTRGFFKTSIPIESYNTGTLTVSRGANSILFGLGSAGGVIDYGLNEAIIGGEETKIGITLDNNRTQRGTLSVARTLVEDRLAIRIDALHSQKKYQQNPAFEDSERFYGAINAVLFKNEGVEWLGKTSLKGNIEIGEIDGTPPSPSLPLNGMASFFEAPPNKAPYEYTGGTAYKLVPEKSSDETKANWVKYGKYDNRPTRKADDSGHLTVGDLANQFTGVGYYWVSNGALVYPNGDGIADLGVAPISDASSPYYNPIFSQNNRAAIQGRNFAGDSRRYVNPNGGYYGQARGFFDVGSTAWETRTTGFSIPSLTDSNVFDYRNQLLSGSTKSVEKDFDTHQFTLEQLLFNGKGGIEVSYASESFDTVSELPFTGASQFSKEGSVYIDMSSHMPNGQENPHYGKPFATSQQLRRQEHYEERENLRATAFYELDFKDHSDGVFGKILGRHRLTGLFQEDDYNTEQRSSSLYAGSVASPGQGGVRDFAWWGSDNGFHSRLVAASNLVGSKIYLSDVSYAPNAENGMQNFDLSDVRLNPVVWDKPQEGDKYTVMTIRPDIDVVDNFTEALGLSEWEMLRFYNTSGGSDSPGAQTNIGRTKLESKSFAWQSYLLDEHIVGLVGWRTDTVTGWNRVSETTELRNPGSYALDLARWNVLESTPSTDRVDGSTLSWSVVAHLPNKIVEKLPVSSASVHIGEGENFSSVLTRRDLYGNQIDNPSGLTSEFGVSFGFADERWKLKINRFETDSTLSSVNTVANNIKNQFTFQVLNRYRNNTGPTAGIEVPFEEQDAFAAGFSSFDDVANTIVDSLPASTKALLDPRLSNGTWVVNDFPNLLETQSVSSEGYEIELVGNPTPNWRVMMNATKVQAITDDSVNTTLAWIDETIGNWKANGIYDLTIGAYETPGNSNVADGSTFAGFIGQHLNGVNAIKAQDGTINQELREWRVNAVTSYDFTEGQLTGFGVGGALRYGSAVSTGYEYRELEEGSGIYVPDLAKPFEGDPDLRGDVWFSYKKRLADKVDWKIQLNIRNAFGSQDNILVRTNPDGKEAVYRTAPDRVYTLQNTFSF